MEGVRAQPKKEQGIKHIRETPITILFGSIAAKTNKQFSQNIVFTYCTDFICMTLLQMLIILMLWYPIPAEGVRRVE